MLLEGTDELGYLLGQADLIAAWEAGHPPRVDTRVGASGLTPAPARNRKHRTVVSAAMSDRRALTIATAPSSRPSYLGLRAHLVLPGLRAPDAPGAVGPGVPDPAPGGGVRSAVRRCGDRDRPSGARRERTLPNEPTLVVVHPGQTGCTM